MSKVTTVIWRDEILQIAYFNIADHSWANEIAIFIFFNRHISTVEQYFGSFFLAFFNYLMNSFLGVFAYN
jgi:hypothetical protein